jgi:hypothetical protein
MAYDDYQIPTCPMTPDDVFAVIIDVTRHAATRPMSNLQSFHSIPPSSAR